MTEEFCPKRFRNALGLFATGVCIATTKSRGEPVGITINSFSSVSLDPPLVLFSAARSLRSFKVFEEAEGFAINVLADDQVHLSDRFARPGQDKWQDLSAEDGRHGGLLIPGALARFDCKRHAAYDGGDHVIFVGRVVDIHTSSDTAPLVYFGSKYRNLADAVPLAAVA
ncbi:flavin reductase family protein [Bordetella sp. 2513F-2]